MNHDKHTLKGTVHPDVRRYLSELGSRGGMASTPAKAKTSRANGKKGGRPRKRVSDALPNDEVQTAEPPSHADLECWYLFPGGDDHVLVGVIRKIDGYWWFVPAVPALPCKCLRDVAERLSALNA